MNVKAKKNNHFLNLLEDRKLAEQYFSGKNMTEFNSTTNKITKKL